MSKILLIGGGGHCKSVLDSLLCLGTYSEIGIIDKVDKLREVIMGQSVIGTDEDLIHFFEKGYKDAVITIGSIGNPQVRIKIYQKLLKIGFSFPIIKDSQAIVSKYAHIEEGVFIGKGAIINTDSIIKKFSIINTGSIIEHDSEIGEFVHIAPGSVIAGEVKVGNYTHIGINSTVKQQVRIGEHCIIGMGSNVLNNIKENTIAYGNPCMEVK